MNDLDKNSCSRVASTLRGESTKLNKVCTNGRQ